MLQNPPDVGYVEAMTGQTLHRLSDIATDQWGLITRRQAHAVGISSTTMERLTAPGAALERVAMGVYRLRGAPIPDHVDLRAAWLQLAPATPAWERTNAQGVVSHRSAAALYGLGHISADVHEFTVATRRQTRRRDVKLHLRAVGDGEWAELRGLPVTRPARIASDLLDEHEDPEAVAQIVSEAIRRAFEYAGTFADAIAPRAARYGCQPGDGLAVLAWLLDLAKAPEAGIWTRDAHPDARLKEAR